MKKISSHFCSILLPILICISSSVYAYREAGHYYTLLAVFDSSLSGAVADEQLSEMKLEAFCAQLPDLAQEMDAITQRTMVFESTSDVLWALLGRCDPDAKIASHMVAVHYYLHGLSGVPGPQLKIAAKDTVKQLTAELAQAKRHVRAERRNLICARGLALHLLGDAYAHVKLKGAETTLFSSESLTANMYDIGLGHTRDSVDPDYLYSKRIDDNNWSQYVRDMSALIAPGADVKRVLGTHSCNGNNMFDCEEQDKKLLSEMVKRKSQLMVDMPKLLTEGTGGIGNMARATTCEQVVKSAFPNPEDRPDCSIVWKSYLQKVIPAFYRQGIDPTAQPKSRADKSCSAWRCKGKLGYEGESPASCTVEIIDVFRH